MIYSQFRFQWINDIFINPPSIEFRPIFYLSILLLLNLWFVINPASDIESIFFHQSRFHWIFGFLKIPLPVNLFFINPSSTESILLLSILLLLNPWLNNQSCIYWINNFLHQFRSYVIYDFFINPTSTKSIIFFYQFCCYWTYDFLSILHLLSTETIIFSIDSTPT